MANLEFNDGEVETEISLHWPLGHRLATFTAKWTVEKRPGTVMLPLNGHGTATTRWARPRVEAGQS